MLSVRYCFVVFFCLSHFLLKLFCFFKCLFNKLLLFPQIIKKPWHMNSMLCIPAVWQPKVQSPLCSPPSCQSWTPSHPVFLEVSWNHHRMQPQLDDCLPSLTRLQNLCLGNTCEGEEFYSLTPETLWSIVNNSARACGVGILTVEAPR